MKGFFAHKPIDSFDEGYGKSQRMLLLLLLTAGVFLRFWGLGDIGLHGDEETMAMPTMSIVETGAPLLPSGMFYPRGLGQLYLMAGSVHLFGESEWAFRFPSAVAGSLMVVAAFFLGRRLLPPAWNVTFVATTSLLPAFIVYSQTARMYIFFLLFTMLFLIALLRWSERMTWGNWWLLLCIYAIGLHFHQLMVFSAFLFILPVTRGLRTRGVMQAMGGFLAAVALYFLFNRWVASNYAETVWDGQRTGGTAFSWPGLDFLLSQPALAAALLGLLVAAVSLLYIRTPTGLPVKLVFFIMVVGLATCAAFNYHAGILMLAVGMLLWFHVGGERRIPVGFILAFVLLLGIQLTALYQTGMLSDFKATAKMLVGSISPYPFVRLAEILPMGAAICTGILITELARFSQGIPLRRHVVLFGLGVFFPLLIIGILRWQVPERYVAGLVPLLILVALMGLHELTTRWKPVRAAALVAPAAMLLLINPVALWRTSHVDYHSRGAPDHKGAAAFVQSTRTGNELILAEDVLQQTYYLGKVDYWLRTYNASKRFLRPTPDGLRDIYTDTPLLGASDQLHRLLASTERPAIYVIGSGETATGREFYLGELYPVLASFDPQVVYTGRDRQTLVWYLPPTTDRPRRETGPTRVLLH